MAGPSRRGVVRPGAMSQAMAAAQVSSEPKALRVGVLHGTRMLDERVLRERGAVTVGTTERNTFTVNDPALPPSFELFTVTDGRYALNVTDAMEGRVALPEGVRSLAELRAGASAHRVPLTDGARGKVHLGELTVLFQFVAAPPAQPKAQLPAAIRAGWVKGVDWTYNASFAFFLMVAVAGVAYAEYVYDPMVELTPEDARLVRLLAAPPAQDEPAPPQEAASAEPARPDAADAPPAPPAHAPPGNAGGAQRHTQRNAEAAAQRAERAADAAMRSLNDSAEFAALVGRGDGENRARDALHNGGLMAGTEADLAAVHGVTAATGQTQVQRGAVASAGGDVGGRRLGVSGRVDGDGNAITSGAVVTRERVLHLDARLGDGDATGGEGTVDANEVARIIRGQLGGIRSCYERSTRNNPSLAGRLDLRFTIGASGRVTRASSSGMSEAPEMGACVVRSIRGLVFPVPAGGSVDFDFPFTFRPGD